MARKHHYRRRSKEQPNELDVTTFLNLMVVLVPFLLILENTAVIRRNGTSPTNLIAPFTDPVPPRQKTAPTATQLAAGMTVTMNTIHSSAP